jgi:hypothetical protein
MEAVLPDQNPQIPQEPEARRGCLPALARLIWIFGGISLIYVALFIAQRKGGLLADLGLLALTLALILVRFVDIRYLEGETMDNKPATLRDWRRYAVKMVIVAGALYAIAKFIAAKGWF